MKIIDMKCPCCGAPLKIKSGESRSTCEYCGAEVLIKNEDYLQNSRIQEDTRKYDGGIQKASNRRKHMIWLGLSLCAVCLIVAYTAFNRSGAKIEDNKVIDEVDTSDEDKGLESPTTSSSKTDTDEMVSTEGHEPPDLTGKWIQENADEDNYMCASVHDEIIEVYFNQKGALWNYWKGTYGVPASKNESYSWISDNTHEENGLLSSGDDTKEFTYKDGKLTFPISIQGESTTVTLIRGSWNIEENPDSNVSFTNNEKAFKQLEIKDSGWIVKDEKWLKYFFELNNPNNDTVVEYPGVRITAYDKDGALLGTTEQILDVIHPGQEYFYAGQAFSVDEQPASVSFEPLTPEDYNLKSISEANQYVSLEIKNPVIRTDTIVGEIYNPNDYEVSAAVVGAICRDSDGEIVDILQTFVDDIRAEGKTPFSMFYFTEKEVVRVDCYAHSWI